MSKEPGGGYRPNDAPQTVTPPKGGTGEVRPYRDRIELIRDAAIVTGISPEVAFALGLIADELEQIKKDAGAGMRTGKISGPCILDGMPVTFEVLSGYPRKSLLDRASEYEASR